MMSDFSPQRLQLADQIKARAPASRLGSQFDAFLFSPIGDDRNGMPLSIVSILARADLDPWGEAASLAGMPVHIATRRLESIIQALPHQPLTIPDSGAVARRLIALLPRTGLNDQGSEKPTEARDAKAVALAQWTKIAAIVVMVFLIFLVCARFARSSSESPMQPAVVTSP